YASLSHCWGTKEMSVVTTQNNIKDMLRSIPVSSLTKTFRDAITITRRLKLQYLWIDSLCIVQGDSEDWVRESAMMASVYAGCFVNLVASAAPDGSVGCLFDRNHDYEYGFKAFVRSEEEKETRELWNFFPEGPGDGYTGQRAWCFQETILAPRSIFFHNKQIYWECRHFRANEAFPQGLEFRTERNRYNITKWQRNKGSQISREWLDLVYRYSGGKLTHWKDRLPALSGIAQVFCKAHALNSVTPATADRQHYLAGMWRFDLEKQLFWSRFDHTQKIIRPGNPYRPTWSWASLAG
ncbi:HET-domain-containing protein, partial [Hyaloscypha variabilis F]